MAAAVGVLSIPGTVLAVEQQAQEATSRAIESMDDEAELDGAREDDGSKALQDRYMHLDLKNIQPLSLEEEEALLGNWGDSEAEDGD